MTNEWGGKREGAGRPKGTTKAESDIRKQRQIRAHDDEWELIRRFAKQLKKGDKTACINFLNEIEQTEQ